MQQNSFCEGLQSKVASLTDFVCNHKTNLATSKGLENDHKISCDFIDA